jgi:hypothetical protein
VRSSGQRGPRMRLADSLAEKHAKRCILAHWLAMKGASAAALARARKWRRIQKLARGFTDLHQSGRRDSNAQHSAWKAEVRQF